ncbi:MAG: TlpA disulfide reductase family protein [Bacteroidia bacterium]
MRQLSIILAFTAISFIACSGNLKDKKSPLSGKLDKHTSTWIYLEQINEATVNAIDSVKTSETGEFAFTAEIKQKDFYRLRVTPNNTVFLVLSPKEEVKYMNSNIMLQEDYTLEGSEEGKLILETKSIREGINAHRDSLVEILNATPAEERQAMQMQMEQGFNDFVQTSLQKARDIIKNNPKSISGVIAAELLDPDQDFEVYSELAANLKKNYSYSGFANSFISRVEQMRATAIGADAPEINLPSPSGQMIPLSSLKGKVVLIDFWASWCGPCRKENPNVVAMYNRLKDKGFTIYSVSLDKNKVAWQEAIAKDNLTWESHVSDLAYWNSVVVKQYGFQGIPFTVLIDRDGKIVAKGLRGEALEQAVSSLL